MTTLVPLRYPRFFQGVFARQRDVYTPLVEEARKVLHELPVPGKLRPFYDTVVGDNPQPSFMLLPLMFLAMAEAAGGIQAAHRRFLPVMMLSLEACSILDDTVDRTPMRSGRPSFPNRFGEARTASFVSSLVATVTREAARVEPRLLEGTAHFIVELSAFQLWERDHIYPTRELFEPWLENRYNQNTVGVAFGLNPALQLHGREPLPLGVMESFGRIFQDVDDIVNIVENRWTQGENDDLLMGAVTRPLLLALDASPSLHADVEALWEVCRTTALASVAEVHREPVHANALVQKRARPVREALIEVGVRGTAAHVLSDCRACVESAPPEFRPVLKELTFTWVDRLRRCLGPELLSEEQIQHALEGLSLEAA